MDKQFVVIDLETTGQSPEKGDRIIEVGIVVIKNDQIQKTYHTLIHPKQEISSFITNLTNISNKDVENAPPFEEKAEEIFSFFKDAYFVAHNVPFDLRFLNYEFSQANLPTLNNKTIDTVEISRILFPKAPSYKLKELANYLHIDHAQPHRALEDALVTAKIFLKLKQKFKQLPFETINQLLKLEKYFHSDVYDFLKERKEVLAFQPTQNNEITSFQGIAFKTLTVKERPNVPYDEAFGYLLEDLYKKQGVMEKGIKNFERREGQREISEIIYDSFLHKHHSFIEAGTGIGKTIAYLIPALYQAVVEGERVVVSTYTTQLQTQLIKEEIPLLKKLLPFPFSVALIKGKRHYLSLERFASELQDETIDNNYDIALTKAILLVWITETNTGDIDEIQLSRSGYYFFQQISTKAEGNLHPKSPWFKYSYYIHAKHCAQKADIVVTNHALLSTDLDQNFELLPNYRYVIIDEAHHFERAVTQQRALALEDSLIRYSLNQLGTTDEDKFIGSRIIKDPFMLSSFSREFWDERLEQAKETVHQLFNAILSYVVSQGSAKSVSDIGRVQYRLGKEQKEDALWIEIKEIASNLIFLFKELIKSLEKLYGIEESAPLSLEGLQKDIRHYIDTFEDYVESLESFFTTEDHLKEVQWIEIEKNERVYLYQKPIHVGNYLQKNYFSKKDSVILTSATLTMRDSFSYMFNKLGLMKEETFTKQISSPFLYDEQVKFMVPKDFPHIVKDEQEFIYATCEVISSIAEITEGRMLVLFTSYQMLRECYYLLQETIDTDEYIVFAQGISSGSRSRLKKNFQSFKKAILLGTSSFWEGIDIPGRDLSSLMIVRLPFQPPNHPVYEARAETIKKEGKNPFFTLALPEAVLRFKQGFGRLIRSTSDRGVVFVCDSRIITSNYSSFFINSIPKIKIHYDNTAQLMKKLEEWF